MARRNLPPLNALVAFEAAARHANFTRAAQELSVAQPAVTRHIHNLEAWIGGPVFTRHGNQVVLTGRGEQLAELATAVFDRLEVGLRPLTSSSEQELRIGASFGVTHLWLMPRISALRAATRTTINFLTSDTYRDFDTLSVDASIRFGDGRFGDLTGELLFPETCQIITSPAFLAAHPEIDPVRLAQTVAPRHMFDHGDPHDHGWMTWEIFASQTGQSLPAATALQKVASYPTMLDMICAGEGIGVGYHGLEDDLIAKGDIIRIGPTFGRERHGYYLVYASEALTKKPLARLRNYLAGQSGLRSVPSAMG